MQRTKRLVDAEERAGVAEHAHQELMAKHSEQGLASQLTGRLVSIEEALRGLLMNQATILEHVRQRAGGGGPGSRGGPTGACFAIAGPVIGHNARWKIKTHHLHLV